MEHQGSSQGQLLARRTLYYCSSLSFFNMQLILVDVLLSFKLSTQESEMH